MTELITDADDLECYTLVRECDTHTALTRGLAEYLAQLDSPQNKQSNQTLRFSKVVTDWADPEERAKDFPLAAVYTQEAGYFGPDDSFQGRIKDVCGTSESIKVCNDFELTLVVDVFTTNKPERINMVMMLEDAFEPVDWMTGFRLHLPHYHGVHANFEMINLDYGEDSDKAAKRWRLAQFQIAASLPRIKLLGCVPRLDIRRKVIVEI